ncbi:restriction endonuclease subunit S [Clostridium perfringens]|uniref:restriction endonuclease subunit S n=1 Tax=Clostridium perfringens TaxID=1502 RepID=UPI002A31DA72|nr:restriction endonuclease subunit S [Clostridium perfringens]
MSFKETEVGRIPIDWEVDELSNKVDLVMGQSPKSEFYNDKGIGMPFMQGRTTFGEKYHYINTWCTDIKRVGIKNSVLMSVRAPVGDVNIATEDICIGRGLASLNMKNKNNEFLYYLLKNYSGLLISKESGTVFGSINKAGIEKLVLPFPNNSEQKAIAKILSDLDEKIEVNNKINKNLEEMAQAIFKQWFVDFEFPNEEGKPYKSSGGEMVKSELGMIPKGWKIFKLGDFIKFIKGKKPKKIEEKFFDGCELYLTIDVLNRNSEIFANKDKIIEVNDDDILMVMDGASSGSLYYGLNGILGSTLAKISVLNTIDKSFLYYYLKLNESSIKSHLTGSAIPHTDKEFINKLCLAIPNDEMILKKADTILNNIRNHTINLNTECSKIKKVRDTLLPKLMSGEIRVPLENSEN